MTTQKSIIKISRITGPYGDGMVTVRYGIDDSPSEEFAERIALSNDVYYECTTSEEITDAAYDEVVAALNKMYDWAECE